MTFFLFNGDVRASTILINEVATKNTTYINGNGRTPDIIELYNNSDSDISLNNWFILISGEKYYFPEYNIKSTEFLTIYCTSDTLSFYPLELNMPFIIPSGGAEIRLYDNHGNLADAVTVPNLNEDESYSRYDDGGSNWVIKDMTIGKPNQSVSVVVSEPRYSVDSGFYDEEFWLSLSTTYNHDIYYTLDGSNPTLESILYNDPILVRNTGDNAFIIRAIATDIDGNYSDIISRTFFVNSAIVSSDYPIISLVVSPNDLYDDVIGIITNPLIRGQERHASYTYFDINRNLIHDHIIGIRIQGGDGNRSHYETKSFLLKARDVYGTGLFSGYFSKTGFAKTLMMRHRDDIFLNGFLQGLTKEKNMAFQEQQIVMVYLNGEFYGEFSLMEKYEASYFETHYNIEYDNIVAIKPLYKKPFDVEAGDERNAGILFNELMEFLQNTDFSSEANYRALGNIIDINSLCVFYVATAYLADVDKNPFEHNSILWRAIHPQDNHYGDGRWRFGMLDFDEAFYMLASDGYKANMFKPGGEHYWARLPRDMIFNNLLRNEEFKNLFVSTFLEMAENEFSAEVVIEKLHMEYGSHPLIEEFFLNRKEYALEHLYDYIENHERYSADFIYGFEEEGGIDSYFNLFIMVFVSVSFLVCFVSFFKFDFRERRM